jgi:hypothetical protein
MLLDLLLERVADDLGTPSEIIPLFATEIDSLHRDIAYRRSAEKVGEILQSKPAPCHFWD